MKLIIFIRKGCCICDSLKKNIKNLNLQNHLIIEEIDIDRYDLYEDKFRKYDNYVPVLALEKIKADEYIELPRCSPRLKDTQLKKWLNKNIRNALGEI